MARSVLDSRNSRILSFPLTVSQQIWLSFLLPSVIGVTIYMLDIGTDIAIGTALILEKHPVEGCVTLAFVYTTPIICFFIQLASPPEKKTFSSILGWLMVEILAMILFPVRPLQCYAKRLLWSIEAVRNKDSEEALRNYDETFTQTYEGYFFLQAFLEAGPQLIMQSFFLVLDVSTVDNTKIMQGFCMVTSVASIALITATYQRYESQCKGRRKRIWKRKEKQKEPLLHETTDDAPRSLPLPRRIQWTKVMEPDDPLGAAIAFSFWFLLLLGRVLCLVIAATFYPWAVLGVIIGHFIFTFLYILPAPDCRTSVPLKMLLAFVFIFCLVEVGVQFRKSYLFHTLFFVLMFIEDFLLTAIWTIWQHWQHDWWFHYALAVMVMTHITGLTLAIIYAKYFRPQTTRVRPNT